MAKEQKQRVVRTSAILVTLLLTAMFSARGATQMLASAVLPLAPEDASGARGARLRAAAVPTDTRETTRQIAEAVLLRNMFDSQIGPMEWNAEVAAVPQPVGPEMGGGGTPLPPDPDGEPDFCSTPVRLVAAMVVPQTPELSFASIEAQGKTMLYRQGMQVDGHEVLGIREHRVFLRPAGRPLCQIAMFKPPQAVAPPPPKPAEPVAEAEPKKTGGTSEDELNQGITQVSDTNYTVSRTLLDKVLSNQAELMRAARIIPYEENGRTTGVKVYGIRRSSLLGKLGIQNGDVLRTINGFDLSSPDSALEAYTKLREMDQFSIAMVRRGQARTMEYSVK
jgi:general secretion pathway protein C